MSRSYARIACSIWDDDDHFMELSPGAQRTYLMLISQKDVSACGTLPLTIRRWAGRLKPEYRDQLGPWLAELSAEKFIICDENTEELLIRTFVKWDGGYTNTKRVLAIHAVSKALRSPILRQVLAEEMGKLGLRAQFSMPGAISADEYPIDAPSDTASDDTSDTRRVVVTKVSSSTSTQNPETTTLEPGANGAGKPAAPLASKTLRGTRLPENFSVTDDMRDWANQAVPGLDVDRSSMMFRNHWLSKTGADATKLDWARTWQNWLMKDFQSLPSRRQVGPRVYGGPGERKSYV